MAFKFNPFTRKLDITSTGGGTGILDITGNTGGPVGADGGNNINLVGSGSVTVAGNSGTNTLTVSVASPTFTWSEITSNQMAATLNGYFINGGSVVEITLPASSSIGDTFILSDVGGNLWKIVQGGAQQVMIGDISTTLGVSGFVESTVIGDSITLVCLTANTIWVAVNGWGNFTVA